MGDDGKGGLQEGEGAALGGPVAGGGEVQLSPRQAMSCTVPYLHNGQPIADGCLDERVDALRNGDVSAQLSHVWCILEGPKPCSSLHAALALS